MSDTLERLRRLQGLRPQKKTVEPELPPAPMPVPAEVPRTLLLGDELANAAGTCYVVSSRYTLATARGSHPLGALLEREPAALAPHFPQFGLHRHLDFTQAAFIDTETTGLGGGAGIYAFMVGVGTFEEVGADWAFVVRQFFMRNPAEEGALLVALADLLGRYAMTVTFNGRAFDLPLLRTRFRYNAWAPDLDFEAAALLNEDRPHLDLLMPARRLWRRRLQSCRLINLEQHILGLARSGDDVPGHMIPQIYVDYMRTGNAADINRVFYHNHEDIVTMVSLAEALTRVLGGHPDDLADEPLDGDDWAALGIAHERRGELAQAEHAYTHALASLTEPASRADVYRRLGALQKRAQRWDDAVATWQQWLSSVPDGDPTPYVELAKYCEWQAKDYDQAAMWAGWALHTVQSLPPHRRAPSQVAELEHRLQRVKGKGGGMSED
jgi:uncharacterized protein YprB with RNaseH-like and TPR domain